MKQGRRTLSAILAMVLVVALCIPAIADSQRYKNYDHYLCLGDSVAAGYGLPYDETKAVFDSTGKLNDWNAICMGRQFEKMPNAYISLVGEQLQNVFGVKATVTQGAYAALRASEVRYMLVGDTFNDPDETHSWDYAFLPFGGDENDIKQGLSQMNQELGTYEKLVEESDLITIGLGTNDILASCLIAAFADDVAEFSPDDPPNAVMTKVLSKYLTPGKISEIKKAIEDGCDENEAAFVENYSVILQRIRTLNPDATVVLMGTYNVLKDTKMLFGMADLSFLLKNMTDETNELIQGLAEKYDCLYADVSDAELYGGNLSDANAMDGLLVKMHPSPEGHRYIARQILHLLTTDEKIRGDVNGDNKVSREDAVLALNHTLLPERYPLEESVDFDGDKIETDSDAIWLQYYIQSPKTYPLH